MLFPNYFGEDLLAKFGLSSVGIVAPTDFLVYSTECALHAAGYRRHWVQTVSSAVS